MTPEIRATGALDLKNFERTSGGQVGTVDMWLSSPCSWLVLVFIIKFLAQFPFRGKVYPEAPHRE